MSQASNTVDSLSRSITTSVIQVTHPNRVATTAHAVLKHIEDDELRRHNGKIIESLRVALPGDPFAQAMAEYVFRKSYAGMRQMIHETQARAAGSDVGAIIAKNAESTENFKVIQTDGAFLSVIEPLHDDMRRDYADIKRVKATLQDMIEAGVLPEADMSSWKKAFNEIKHLPKGTTAARTALKKLLHKDHINESVVTTALRLRNVIADYDGNKPSDELIINLVAETVEDFSDPNVTDLARRTAAQTGAVSEQLLWQDVLNRVASHSKQLAASMADFNVASELQSKRVAVLNFSRCYATVNGAIMPTPAMQTEATTITRFENKRIDEDGNIVSDQFVGLHKEALLLHILLYAGAQVELFNPTETAGLSIDRPACLIPLDYNVMGDYISSALTYAYESLTAEPIKLRFYERLCYQAKRQGNALIMVASERELLLKALKDDIKQITELVTEVTRNGHSVSASGLIDKAYRRHVIYEDELVTPFDKGVLITNTNVATFMQTGTVAATNTKDMGVVAHPKHNGRGFAEGIIGEDHHGMLGAITQDVSMEEIGTLYNRVTDVVAGTSRSLVLSTRIENALSAALYDHNRMMLRRVDGNVESVMASDIVADSNFEHLSGDFFAFVKETKENVLVLYSGLGRTRVKRNVFGNVFGSWSYGEVVPEGSMNNTTPYEDTIVDMIGEVLNRMVGAYAPRRVTVKQTTTASIDLKEENDKYAHRLGKYVSAFKTYSNVDMTLLRTLSNTSVIYADNQPLFSRDVVDVMRPLTLMIRDDAQSMLQLVAERHAQQIMDTGNEDQVAVFMRVMTRTMQESDRRALLQRTFHNSVAAMRQTLDDTLNGLGPVLQAVYVTELFAALQRVLPNNPLTPNQLSINDAASDDA